MNLSAISFFALHVCWARFFFSPESTYLFLSVGERDLSLDVDLRDVAGVHPPFFGRSLFLSVSLFELVVPFITFGRRKTQRAVSVAGFDFAVAERASGRLPSAFFHSEDCRRRSSTLGRP